MPLSAAKTILLGAIAGSTIFLGLPMGRMKTKTVKPKAFLNAMSAGILIFLLFDILEHATEPLEDLVADKNWGKATGMAAVYIGGLAVGLMTLVYEWRVRQRIGGGRGKAGSVGPGAMAVEELVPHPHAEARRLGMMIAAGIGLHNFSEGLAIGQSAHNGDVSLALLLVIGFALHNMTEGFGIVGPLAAAGAMPSWGYLLVAGLIGGGPTFLGTIIGVSFTNAYIFVGFLTLAAGAIIYVIGELFNVGRRIASWELTMWGILAGFVIALATEMVVVASGV